MALLASGSALAGTHTVTQNGDAGVGSLRWAVEQANAGSPAEAQEIRFSLAEPFRQINLVLPVVVTHPNVSILGLETAGLDSPGRIRIGRPGVGSGVLALTSQVTRFSLRDLDLGPSAMSGAFNRGGCLDAAAVSPTFSQITIERVVFEGCMVLSTNAPPAGGAVYANGGVLVRDSLFRNNRIELSGDSGDTGKRASGGALAMERGLLTVIDTTFESNVAEAQPAGGIDRALGGAVAYTAANGFGMSFDGALFVDNRAGGVDCGAGSETICDVRGSGGAVSSFAASTTVRRSALARNAAGRGAAIYQVGNESRDARLDLDNVVFSGGAAFEGTVFLGGARLRQRNVTYHDVAFDERAGLEFNRIPVLYLAGSQVDVSHSVLIGRVIRTPSTQNDPICLEFGPPPSIQGNSLVVEPLNPDTGSHSCAFLGATRVSLADVGIPETGRWDFEPRGLALENGAAGAPSSLDWSRCSPFDAFGRARNIDADGDGTASCDVGGIEGLSLDPDVFSDGFE